MDSTELTITPATDWDADLDPDWREDYRRNPVTFAFKGVFIGVLGLLSLPVLLLGAAAVRVVKSDVFITLMASLVAVLGALALAAWVITLGAGMLYHNNIFGAPMGYGLAVFVALLFGFVLCLFCIAGIVLGLLRLAYGSGSKT